MKLFPVCVSRHACDSCPTLKIFWLTFSRSELAFSSPLILTSVCYFNGRRLTWCSLVYKVSNLPWGKTWNSARPAVCCSRNISNILHAKTDPMRVEETSPRWLCCTVRRSLVPLTFSPQPSYQSSCPLQFKLLVNDICFVYTDGGKRTFQLETGVCLLVL